MQKNREGIIGQVIKLDNSVRIRACNFTRFQNTENIYKTRLSFHNIDEVQDYKNLKASLENINFNIQYKKLAFQPIRVMTSKHK